MRAFLLSDLILYDSFFSIFRNKGNQAVNGRIMALVDYRGRLRSETAVGSFHGQYSFLLVPAVPHGWRWTLRA
jgi:hypothetical protein